MNSSSDAMPCASVRRLQPGQVGGVALAAKLRAVGQDAVECRAIEAGRDGGQSHVDRLLVACVNQLSHRHGVARDHGHSRARLCSDLDIIGGGRHGCHGLGLAPPAGLSRPSEL